MENGVVLEARGYSWWFYTRQFLDSEPMNETVRAEAAEDRQRE